MASLILWYLIASYCFSLIHWQPVRLWCTLTLTTLPLVWFCDVHYPPTIAQQQIIFLKKKSWGLHLSFIYCIFPIRPKYHFCRPFISTQRLSTSIKILWILRVTQTVAWVNIVSQVSGWTSADGCMPELNQKFESIWCLPSPLAFVF